MPGPLLLRFLPSRLPILDGLSQRGYRAYVTEVGRDRFDGRVDYEVRFTPFSLDRVQVFRGQWEVRGGILDVAGASPVRSGLYHTRIRVAGSAGSFGPWELLMADEQPPLRSVPPGAQRIAMAPPGSWMVFENRGPGGVFLGYTRIDIETDPGLLGVTWRFTKSARGAFWAPGEDAALRWFLREQTTPLGSFLRAAGGLTLRSPWSELGASQLNVGYDGNGPGGVTRGLLGGFGPHAYSSRLDVYEQAEDAWLFYALLPADRAVPAALSNQAAPMVDLVAGRLSGLPELIDLWHMAVMAPTRSDAALRMRYGEAGIRLGETTANRLWSVIEDWEWRTDGLVSRIVQWQNQPPSGWRGGYPDLIPAHLRTELTLVASGLPDARALSVQFWDARTAKAETVLDLAVGAPYQLLVRDADGRPYHGFLEMQLLALRQDGQWRTFTPPQAGLWRDVSGRPIYVSHGQVTVGPPAHGNPRDWGVQLVTRPYLVNSSVNALQPARSETLVPNHSQAAWSNAVTLTVGAAPG